MTTKHAFEPDLQGDCQHCPLPSNHPMHDVEPDEPPVATTEGKRPFNLLSKEEGRALAATSRASEEVRRTLFLAMAEVATRQEYVTVNDAWDLLEVRGYRRSGHAQSAGTIGNSGKGLGLWEPTQQTALNTSGNGHSRDNGVRVYASKIVGKDFETEIAPLVVEKARALAAETAIREETKAREAYDAIVPPGSERREEHRIWDDEVGSWSTTGDTPIEWYRERGYRTQARVVVETPWTDVE